MANPWELIQKAKHYIKRAAYHKHFRELPEIKGGYGAFGQDILVAELLGNKRGGVFVDIGANDGVQISNTCYFERELGWTGVAIEPIPAIYEKLATSRRCMKFNGCVTTMPGKAKFLEVIGGPNMLSTLAMHNEGLTARRLRQNAKRHNAQIREIDVECITFAGLTEKFSITEVDFLSLDIEGGELQILKSIDFDKTPVRVISVENNYFTTDIRRYLEGQGYFYLGTFRVDEIYVYGGNGLRRSCMERL
jgi:FkbM family methyltransferase